MEVATAKVRVLLADPAAIVRRAVRMFLEGEGFDVCADAGNGLEAVEMTVRLAPEVAILDFPLPGLHGMEVAREIRRKAPETRILFFTLYEEAEAMREAQAAGAHGFVSKTDDCKVLVAGIQALSRRETFFSVRTVTPPRKERAHSS